MLLYKILKQYCIYNNISINKILQYIYYVFVKLLKIVYEHNDSIDYDK